MKGEHVFGCNGNNLSVSLLPLSPSLSLSVSPSLFVSPSCSFPPPGGGGVAAVTQVEKVQMLNEDIGKLLAQAELLGSNGIADQSQRVLEEVDRLTQLKKESEQEYRNNIPTCSLQQQKLRVCDVCGAYLGLQEKDKRLADHFRGRLHMGFMEIRSKLQQVKKTLAEKLGMSNSEFSRHRDERRSERRPSERRPEGQSRPRPMRRRPIFDDPRDRLYRDGPRFGLYHTF
ncbi:putative RNA-binding protein Luc7-like 1 [Rhincodon typus]|uniref:putative RNA-binding protein Luc7-like 1 n=1 Tax=Rhincodon typus TaxID=259920 RepID=UPI00202F9C56|nr:putative RNA-binding protein Luc7-like 1 [Rhincodon typus]